MDEREKEMTDVLQELENLNARDPQSTHSESPLGQVDERRTDENDGCNQPAIGPLPAIELGNTVVPAIAPPPGWKPMRNGLSFGRFAWVMRDGTLDLGLLCT